MWSRRSMTNTRAPRTVARRSATTAPAKPAPTTRTSGADTRPVSAACPPPSTSDACPDQRLAGQPRALQAGADLLHRDVAREVGRAMLGLDVAREGREAAVVGRAQALDRDVLGREDQLVADVLGRLDLRRQRVDDAHEADLRHPVGVLARVLAAHPVDALAIGLGGALDEEVARVELEHLRQQ